jgi:glycosyltransferase involved in cell wall biosynthesis
MPSIEQSGLPRFSVVSAVYNVSLYLDDYFASLERQSIGITNLDIILVNDGSTDDSGDKCDAFAAKWPLCVRVVHKENGGAASARNTGLDLVRGDWVNFCDPDDMLDENFFDRLGAFIDENVQVDIVATPVVFYYEEDGRTQDSHPLSGKFGLGTRTIDLALESDALLLHVASSLFRVDTIRRNQFRMDKRIRPTFEDAHFVARFFLSLEHPTLGVVADTRYLYRKRSNLSSALDTAWSDPDRFTQVPRFGHLALLQQARTELGAVPAWLENTVLYDLCWYFKTKQANVPDPGATFAAFHEAVAEILTFISPESIRRFSIHQLSDEIRFALLNGYSAAPDRPVVRLISADNPRRLVQFRYRFTGDAPSETFVVDGIEVVASHSKYRSMSFLGKVLYRERVVWLPRGAKTRIALDGHFVAIGADRTSERDSVAERAVWLRGVDRLYKRPLYLRNPREGWKARFTARTANMRRAWTKPALYETALSIALHSPFYRRKFLNAWIFMDRDTDANDNAEHLYRYVAQHQPQVNSWFVLRKGAPGWDRLKKEGFRLVAYGSFEWNVLHLSAIHFASSHADYYVVEPQNRHRFGPNRWRFTFLQHGVIIHDLSRWLNSKNIDLFVTTSPAEYESIVGDDSSYVFTSKEVVLAGLPRHDALIALRDTVPPIGRRLILVMPTWRKPIAGEVVGAGSFRATGEGFAETEYAIQWSGAVRAAAEAPSVADGAFEIVFVPHPNMKQYLSEFDLPQGVRTAQYAESDIQSLLARAALLITDYSSIAFDAARIDVPIVYFQFDADKFFSGEHTYTRGYFSYPEDGFGPVCSTIAGVLKAIPDMLASESTESSVYRSRREERFAVRDGNNSRRVYEAMLRLNEKEPEALQASSPKPAAPASVPVPQAAEPAVSDDALSNSAVL